MTHQCFAVLLLVSICSGQSIQNTPTTPALSNSEPLEQYVEAFALINMVHKTVFSNILNPTNLTNYQTHYAIIVKVLQDLTATLANTNETYDESYDLIVGKSIMSAMENPSLVVTQLNKQFEVVKIQVLAEFANVTADICPSAVDPSICNILIDNLFTKLLKYLNPWTIVQLKHLRNVFLTLRDTASAVLGYDRTFKTVSEDHSAVKYVVEGKEDLRPLVKKLVNFVNLVTDALPVEKLIYKRI